MTTETPSSTGIPFDVEIDTDPYDIWRRLRDDAPLYRNERYDFYALSRFDDVEAAHRDPKTFSSAHGTVLELMEAQPDRRRPDDLPGSARPHPAALAGVAGLHPATHRASSRTASASCAATSSTPPVRRGTFDYVQDFGARLPAMVIASLLGVPLEDQNRGARATSTRSSTSSRTSA